MQIHINLVRFCLMQTLKNLINSSIHLIQEITPLPQERLQDPVFGFGQTCSNLDESRMSVEECQYAAAAAVNNALPQPELYWDRDDQAAYQIARRHYQSDNQLLISSPSRYQRHHQSHTSQQSSQQSAAAHQALSLNAAPLNNQTSLIATPQMWGPPQSGPQSGSQQLLATPQQQLASSSAAAQTTNQYFTNINLVSSIYCQSAPHTAHFEGSSLTFCRVAAERRGA